MSDRTIIVQIRIIKNPNTLILNILGNLLAEKEGFEPLDVLASKVFKTAAFDHSGKRKLMNNNYILIHYLVWYTGMSL